MHRFRRLEALVLLGLGEISAGCAFAEGDPFGFATIECAVQLQVPEDRRRDGELIATSSGYLFRFDQMTLSLERVALEISNATTRASFDPARPPEGYSLCHNGHCHAADGRLVDYEDIEAELAGAGGGGVLAIGRPASSSPIEIGATRVPVELGACEEACALARGELSAVTLALRRIEVKATVFAGPGRGRNLPAEGLTVYFSDAAPWALRETVRAPVDVFEPLFTHVSAELRPGVRLFDGVDWVAYTSSTSSGGASLVDNPALRAEVLERFRASTELSINLVRDDAMETAE